MVPIGVAINIPYRLPDDRAPFSIQLTRNGLNVGNAHTPTRVGEHIYQITASFDTEGIYTATVRDKDDTIILRSTLSAGYLAPSRDPEWHVLVTKVDDNTPVIDGGGQTTPIGGLTDSDITIIQGQDWALTVNYTVPTGATIDFLLRDEAEYEPGFAGTVTIPTSRDSFTLSLSDVVTSALKFTRYRYVVNLTAGEHQEQLMRGVAIVQKSIRI